MLETCIQVHTRSVFLIRNAKYDVRVNVLPTFATAKMCKWIFKLIQKKHIRVYVMYIALGNSLVQFYYSIFVQSNDNRVNIVQVHKCWSSSKSKELHSSVSLNLLASVNVLLYLLFFSIRSQRFPLLSSKKQIAVVLIRAVTRIFNVLQYYFIDSLS